MEIQSHWSFLVWPGQCELIAPQAISVSVCAAPAPAGSAVPTRTPLLQAFHSMPFSCLLPEPLPRQAPGPPPLTQLLTRNHEVCLRGDTDGV